MNENVVFCTATHPTTGEPCIKYADHVENSDATERQHLTEGNRKWPTLHELDPAEGFNPPMPHRI